MTTNQSALSAYTNVATFCVHGRRSSANQRNSQSHRFIMLSPPPTSWKLDAEGRLILLQVAASINLHTSVPSDQQGRLAYLPSDIHYLILDHLHPIDRVCLALTCKILCSSVTTAPGLTHKSWAKFTSPLSGSYNANFCNEVMPEMYSLTFRLAHGWIDKVLYRYCWKCHRILTRKEDVWRNRLPESQPGIKVRINLPLPWKRTTTKRNVPASALEEGKRKLRMPKWSVKTCVDQRTWERWGRAERYDHLVKTWCFSPNEDSSLLYCDYCRVNSPTGILDGACGSAMESGAIHPVECPTCLERELTWVWRKQSRLGRGTGTFGHVLNPWVRRLGYVVDVSAYIAKRPWKIPMWILTAAWYFGVCVTEIICLLAGGVGKWCKKFGGKCHGRISDWLGNLRTTADAHGAGSAC